MSGFRKGVLVGAVVMWLVYMLSAAPLVVVALASNVTCLLAGFIVGCLFGRRQVVTWLGERLESLRRRSRVDVDTKEPK